MDVFAFLNGQTVDVEQLEVTKAAKAVHYSPLMGKSEDLPDAGDAE